MDRILPVLFLDDEARPLEFSMRGLPSETSIVSSLIKKGGGIIHIRRDGPHTIILDKPESRIFDEKEYFSYHYIADCCDAKCLQDLNKYKLNKNSKYIQDYDANLVLLKKKSWKDIPLKSENNSDVEEIDEESGTIPYDSPPHSRRLKTLPRLYCDSERKAILKWIIKNKAYSSVGGNALWMQMEKEEVCEGRSWQSLKEHFKKKIMPSITKFGLSEKHVKYFKTRRSYLN